MASAGVSTLGITLGYGLETVAGTKPSEFKQLNRINNISAITLETEQIDASALEDLATRYIAGRQDSGGSWAVSVNLTDETQAEWENLIKEYNELGSGLHVWFEIIVPGMEKAFFVVAQPPQVIPFPEMAQNGLLTVDVTLSIEEYKGMDTKVAFA